MPAAHSHRFVTIGIDPIDSNINRERSHAVLENQRIKSRPGENLMPAVQILVADRLRSNISPARFPSLNRTLHA